MEIGNANEDYNISGAQSGPLRYRMSADSPQRGVTVLRQGEISRSARSLRPICWGRSLRPTILGAKITPDFPGAKFLVAKVTPDNFGREVVTRRAQTSRPPFRRRK